MDSLQIDFSQQELESILNLGTTIDVSPFWSTISQELPVDIEDFLSAELSQIANDLEGFLLKVVQSSPISPLEPSQYLFDIGGLLRSLSVSDPQGLLQCWNLFVQFVND